MDSELRDELSEEELVKLRIALKGFRDRLSVRSYDRDAIDKLIQHVDKRLKIIAWEKYAKEKGIE